MQSHLRPVMALPIACSSPEPSLSMVGHAPTTLESEDLAQDIRTVYGTLDSDDVKMIVMDDALDQCDRILIPGKEFSSTRYPEFKVTVTRQYPTCPLQTSTLQMLFFFRRALRTSLDRLREARPSSFHIPF